MKRGWRGLTAAAVVPAVLTACGCPTGYRPATLVTAYFGLGMAGDAPPIAASAWDAFVVARLTPAFPDGLTVADAVGQWRDATGGRIREPARMLTVVLPAVPAATAAARIGAVAAHWRQAHDQASVLVTLGHGCAAG